MLINRAELARKMLEGEITSLDDLNSVLRSMIKDVVETAMGAFLSYDRYQTPDGDAGNRRNGHSQKELASKVGPIVIDVPRDRKSEFAPALVKKRQRLRGTHPVHVRQGDEHPRYPASRQGNLQPRHLAKTVSRITDAVIDKAKEWQNRPLEPIYAIVFMDALFLKLRIDGRVKNVAAYLMVGIDWRDEKSALKSGLARVNPPSTGSACSMSSRIGA